MIRLANTRRSVQNERFYRAIRHRPKIYSTQVYAGGLIPTAKVGITPRTYTCGNTFPPDDLSTSKILLFAQVARFLVRTPKKLD